MTRTLKLEFGSKIAIVFEQLDDLSPHWHIAVSLRIAYDVAPVLRS